MPFWKILLLELLRLIGSLGIVAAIVFIALFGLSSTI